MSMPSFPATSMPFSLAASPVVLATPAPYTCLSLARNLLHAELLHPLALDGALDVVGGDYAREGALAARVVLLRRALAARAWVLRQLQRRVRRADLHEVRLVGDRDRD